MFPFPAIPIFMICLILTKKIIKIFFYKPPVPQLEDTWWGRGAPWDEDKSIRPFKIEIPDKDLDDLKQRLNTARPFTPPLEGIQQQYGMNTNLLKEIVDFWKTKYDWRERENYLNQYPQFLTSIQGLDIHYIHVKPENVGDRKVLPLLLLHGWPGSVREFYEIIPKLTKPDSERNFVFEVIVPSLPGYGFSQAAVRPGLGAAQMAVVFKNFMKRLGYDKFYTQGGDFGGIILQYLSVMYPENVLGYHTNMVVMNTPLANLKILIGALWPTWFTPKEHVDRVYPLKEQFFIRLRETGYFHIQATKPDTIGVGLKDSPVGLAAYILEKFVTGTNRLGIEREDGALLDVWKYENLLDNVMIYWFSGSMPTAVRLYAETFNKAHNALGLSKIPIKVPTAIARFNNDFYAPDGVLSEVYKNLLHLADYDGGHFAAFQVPDTLAKDIYTAVSKFERHNTYIGRKSKDN